ncbi:MAG: tetratricopeptide repeat protein [Gammaproteobacteria bacterium]|nr:tetratricopeptide repeat protein [Gammaproteobacteria bacterium]
MPTDPMNLELTASSDEAAASFAACQEGYFTFATDIMDRLKAALAIDPAMPMALCLRGYLLVLSRRREYLGLAQRVVDTLEKERSLLMGREAQHLDALTAWIRGDTERTLALWEAILNEHPTDTVALRLAHFTYLYNGRSREMRDSVNRVAYAWDPEQPWYGHFLGMQAFGLEEMGDYARAQQLGEEALERNPVEPWGVHAVAHCLEMQDRWDEGRVWIERRKPNWRDSGLSNHLAWHEALMCIDAGDEQGALSVLDEALAREDADMPPHITDSVSLLQRLELCGVEAGERWERIADLCAERDHDHSLVFFDAHYMLAYAGAGRETKAKEFLASLEAFAHASDGATATLARHAGVRVLGALMDYKLGRIEQAYEKLAPLRYEIAHFGGSHAQRDLFHQIIVDAAIRSGHQNDALALLSERTQAAPGNALSQLRLADVLEKSRMTGRANQARERAAELRAVDEEGL